MEAKHRWIGTSWKMNKLRAEAIAFADGLRASPLSRNRAVTAFVIPPFPYVADVAQRLEGTPVLVGAQNMHWDDRGAWTGEVSPLMLKDCGAKLVEIGHSERRSHFGETDETVALKIQAALRHGLQALVCVGDTREEYKSGRTAEALERKVRAALEHVGPEASGKVILAYEPVWAIGETGTAAAPEFVNEQHERIAALVVALTGGRLPVIYGGSVNLENCAALVRLPHVDGLFIGRAAWDIVGYLGIIGRVLEELT
jgi:triosephosphate isomerase